MGLYTIIIPLSIVIFSYPQYFFLCVLSCCVQHILVHLVLDYNYHHNNYDSKPVATHYLLLKLQAELLYKNNLLTFIHMYQTNLLRILKNMHCHLNNKTDFFFQFDLLCFLLVLVSYPVCRKYGIVVLDNISLSQLLFYFLFKFK